MLRDFGLSVARIDALVAEGVVQCARKETDADARRQKGEVHHGLAGNTRQDQGAIARFVASQGRGLHDVAVKSPDIYALLGSPWPPPGCR